MEPLTSPTVLRALGFLILTNDNGANPAPEQLDAYALIPFPQTAAEKFYRDEPRQNLLIDGLINRDYLSDSTTGYLIATGMAEDEGDGVHVTDLGRAFNAGAGRTTALEASERGVLEVVGRLDDPVVYAQLLTEIDRLGEVLVVDPYLPSRDLFALLSLPNARRFLTRDTHIASEKQDERSRKLAIALGAQPRASLRFDQGRELHDRCIVPAEGPALLLGTSLGGTQMTVITYLGEETTALLRSHYEDIWSRAHGLDPIIRRDIDAEE